MTKALPVREDGSCNPSGLKLIEELAGQNKTQASIAAALGISRKKFEHMLARQKGENPERLAWERGAADAEQRIADSFFSAGLGTVTQEDLRDESGKVVIDPNTNEPVKVYVRTVSKMGSVNLMFLAKTQYGWSEKPTAIINDQRVQLTLPLPTSAADYFKRMGLTGPVDFRKDKSVPVPEGMKLVNPSDVKAIPDGTK